VSRRRPELTRDGIAAAALVVVDRDGASAFSMRAVATEVGVSPMSLYHHVADRAELVMLMVDAAMREVAMPGPSGDGWRDDLWHLARWLRDGATRHPDLGSLVGELRGASDAMYAFGEYWVGLWRLSAIADERVFDAAMASLTAVVAMAMHLRAGDGAESHVPQLRSVPNLRHAIEVAGDPAATFALAIRGTIDGIEARLSNAAVAPEG
jgi:AcrR family transcriptional regulator